MAANIVGPVMAVPNEPFNRLLKNRRNTSTISAIEAEDHATDPWCSALDPLRQRSAEYFEARRRARELPAANARDAFMRKLQKERILIVTGATGCGKSTQLPQFIMYDELPQAGHQAPKIVCTQPRRIATRELPRRVALEMGVELGTTVGFKYRNEEAYDGNETRLVYMTDGRLLADLVSDRFLKRYSCVIVDEAHERNAQIDLLLGLLKRLVLARKDLRLIIMSATMDASLFSEYFGGASVFHIPGRTFPVQVNFLGNDKDKPEKTGRGVLARADYVESAVKAVMTIVTTPSLDEGDILVFVAGKRDITTVISGIKYELALLKVDKLVCYPFHGELSNEEQNKALADNTTRRCIVATKIAETSVTIDGIVHVVDCGVSKEMVYNPRLKLYTLHVEPISKAAAKQRVGRAGRTRNGFCWRLYSQYHFDTVMSDNPLPGLLRDDLADAVLKLLSITENRTAENIMTFPFITKPAPEVMLRTWWELQAIGCFDSRATSLQWVVTPARCISRRRDHFTLLNIWNAFFFELQKLEKSKHMTRAQRDRHIEEWSLENYLDKTALQSAKNTFDRVIKFIMKEEIGHFDDNRPPLPAVKVIGTPMYYVAIKKCLLQAFFTEIAVHETKVGGENDYRLLVENQSARVHPASVVASGYKPDFVFFDKLLDQGKAYYWTCTGFESRWLFEDPLIADYINKLLDKSTQEEGQRWGRAMLRLDMAREKYRKSLPPTA
ncbi:DEAH-box ATP-dependent RNA helicase prp43 [Gnomoniopsis sp. IMI 355080]|nr:DEAH-box ATP-dependent RNA helicase prp43 [Gnomoniopsis sp. IMI 355080]